MGDEKLTSREDQIGLLFLYVKSDENMLPKVNKISKTEAQTFNIFDKLIGPLQFCMWGLCFWCIFDVSFVSKKGPKDYFEVIIDLAYFLLYGLKKLIHPLILKVKKQRLIEVVIISDLFWEIQCLLNDFMWV